MTNEKVIEVCRTYENKIHSRTKRSTNFALTVREKHLLDMIVKVRQFIVEGRREKAFRWLGFVQGVLWCEGIYTIDELRDHNRPANEPFVRKYCARCNTLDAVAGKDHCSYCLQLPPEDFAKPVTQAEIDGLRW